MNDSEESAIILPLDGSRTSAAALGAARALSAMTGGNLHIIHVTDVSFPEEQLLGHLNVEENFDHIPHKLSGDVVDAVLDLALSIHARMIVMSTHGATFDSNDILGSKARGLAQNITLPILLIRPAVEHPPQADWKPARMLVPLDGTPIPLAVVDEIFDLAETLSLEIDLLHIAERSRRQPREAGSYTSPRYLDRPYYDWPEWADEFIRRFTARRLPAVKLDLLYQQGDPVKEALEFSSQHHADIIALSWRGSMEAKHANTVKGILRETQSPVLLLRIL